MTKHYWYLILFGCFAFSCKQGKKEIRFSVVPAAQSAITFENTIQETEQLNVMKYEYMYNGGGVAVGDLNGDSLPDIYLTGNMVPDKLYLNQGKLSFKDITEAAGIQNHKGWKTGVTMADVNADGLLDIYVCYSGNTPLEERGNQLFINQGVQQGVPVFKEMAAAYGLDGKGSNSTQAAFFDYDRDGDLDMFLLNHATMFYNPFYNTEKLRTLRHPYFGNKLYRNDSLHFTDVSEAAGIKGGGINFGLGIGISDVNNDGWPDIYVTNDYEEQDFLYLNNHDGTFNSQAIKESIAHISRNGMGVDIADYNNDGLQDIIVLDMLPEDNYRQKMLRGPDDYDKYHLLVDNGYYHQNMRNTLQLNNGITPAGIPLYSEIGQLAGVSNTDWSWCPLLADFDNDGYKDLFITNGFLRDFTNLDFVKYVYQDKQKNQRPYEIVKQLPATRISNYAFRNNGDLTFQNATEAWGLSEASISNGAVYADLDNDGDLDLVTNNINQPAFLYRNNADHEQSHYIKIKLKGFANNTSAVGAKVGIRVGGQLQVQELYPTRGFQSCMPAEIIFGTGPNTTIDSLWVLWPDRKIDVKRNVKTDTMLVWSETADAPDHHPTDHNGPPWFEDATRESAMAYRHVENDFIDFKTQYLLPYQLSKYGPSLASGDVDGDGSDDLFIGGASGHPGRLYLNTSKGFTEAATQPWKDDGLSEDTGALFFDADNDGDRDLYLVHGGVEFPASAAALLQDKLFENDGKGNFKPVTTALPREVSNGSCIAASDFDKDGDLDLFVGARSIPGNYPLPSISLLLRNDSRPGKILFTNITPDFLRKPGMVTSGVWMDYNHDAWPDLLLAGEFMPVMLFENRNGTFTDQTASAGLSNTSGLWCKLLAADVDNDGDLDVIAGNAGLNLPFRTSEQEPIALAYGDFNGDGQVDPLMTTYVQGKRFPYPSRDELLEVMPALKKKFVTYASYATATMEDVLSVEALRRAGHLEAAVTRSCFLINSGNGKFDVVSLPVEAQFSMNSALAFEDFNADGIKDLALAGNFYPYRVQAGRCDASSGLILKGTGHGKYEPLSFNTTGFYAAGDVRTMVVLKANGNENQVVIGVNDASPVVYRYKTK